jgi:hypothetical protein
MDEYDRLNSRNNCYRIILCADDAPTGSSTNGMPVLAVQRAYESEDQKGFYLFPFTSPIYSVALRDEKSHEPYFAYVMTDADACNKDTEPLYVDAGKLTTLFTLSIDSALTRSQTSYRPT